MYKKYTIKALYVYKICCSAFFVRFYGISGRFWLNNGAKFLTYFILIVICTVSTLSQFLLFC